MYLLDKIIYCYENITPFQTALSIGLIILYVLYLFLRDMDVPPGPRGSPIFGYWPYLNSDTCHLHFQELAKKYGDVFSFRMAGTLIVHLGSIKAVREAHITKSECFAGRYEHAMVMRVFRNGVAVINGEPWKVLRKFFISMYKEYGVNNVKDHAATSVYDAMKEIVDEIESAKGRPIDTNDMVTRKCIDIFRRVIFNEQGITTEELRVVNDAYAAIMQDMTSVNFMLIGKFVRYFIFPFMPAYWRIVKYSKIIDNIMFKVVNRHKLEQNQSQVGDIIDSFYKERDERLKKGDSTAKYFTDEALVGSLNQMVTDGIQTVCVFVENFLTMLVKYPDEQDKIYEEICEVIGTERLPTLEDKTNLSYTNAFMNEVQRITDFLPMFPSLECTKETTVQGYKIPEGAVTLLSFYCAHRNPKDFENPDEFNPSRYLPEQGKPRPELPILFGIGKRACMGEGFSIIVTFLMLTSIIQNFRLSLPADTQVTSKAFCSKEKVEICAHPRPHKSHSL